MLNVQIVTNKVITMVMVCKENNNWHRGMAAVQL